MRSIERGPSNWLSSLPQSSSLNSFGRFKEQLSTFKKIFRCKIFRVVWYVAFKCTSLENASTSKSSHKCLYFGGVQPGFVRQGELLSFCSPRWQLHDLLCFFLSIWSALESSSYGRLLSCYWWLCWPYASTLFWLHWVLSFVHVIDAGLLGKRFSKQNMSDCLFTCSRITFLRHVVSTQLGRVGVRFVDRMVLLLGWKWVFLPGLFWARCVRNLWPGLYVCQYWLCNSFDSWIDWLIAWERVWVIVYVCVCVCTYAPKPWLLRMQWSVLTQEPGIILVSK